MGSLSKKVNSLEWVALPAVFAAFVALSWALGTSDSSRIFNLPFSDSMGYFDGAVRLGFGQKLAEFTGRRPLYTGFLSSLLDLTGNSLLLALVLQALFGATAISWFRLQTERSFGKLASWVTAGILAAFFVRFAGKTLTENLGFPLAVLAWGYLIRASDLKKSFDLRVGFFLLTLALLARAGAFFVIPALMLSLRSRFKGKALWKEWAACSCACLGAVGINQLYQRLLVGERSLGFSNFSHTLYGTAMGGKPWTYSYEIFGKLGLNDSDLSRLVYKAAWAEIQNHPFQFLKGCLNSVFDFLAPGIHSATGFVSGILPSLLRPVVFIPASVFFLAGLVVLLKPGEKSSGLVRILRWGTFGVLLSIPFVPPIDADMMRAHAAVIPLIAWITTLGAFSVFRIKLNSVAREGLTRFERVFPAVIGTAILLTLALPLLRAAKSPAPQSQPIRCASPKDIPWTIQRSFPSVEIDTLGQLERVQARHPYPGAVEPLIAAFREQGPFRISLTYILETQSTWYTLIPKGLEFPPQTRACIRQLPAENLGKSGKLSPLWVTQVVRD